MARQVIPEYWRLDESGEVAFAAARMEARSRAPASQEMFRALVLPLLDPPPRAVLELGCGTAALARRIARTLPEARVCAADKSRGMLAAAARHVGAEGLANVELAPWDVVEQERPPFDVDAFDLIVSSVVLPYLTSRQTEAALVRLAGALAPRGVLGFVEQDLMTDSVHFPSWDLCRRVFDKDSRKLRRSHALGLRPLLRAAGLELLPRASFLWTDEEYGPYCRELLERTADSALDARRITSEECGDWKATLERLAAAGDFHYGLVYHRIAGRRSTTR